ncbi:androgen-dependent TFPI-regulating protein isoform X1 [Echinops telfairi]|uniref:Androgen-dependent TFPI-regulating protein isoform X1 n=1 Tax=Echinops telfairi TaxID=9371 RepID=A0AC55DPV4_ECHTE|nr:androgen-dependent TFPI-regulating protein isoform X1 [Echinops telfairi]
MARAPVCIYHFLVLNWYIFLNYCISQLKMNPRAAQIFQHGGQWKYLTLINLVLQAIFHGAACLDDVLKGITRKKDIKFITAFRNLLFTCIAFPISTYVCVAFWALFLYDRELIYPKGLEEIISEWLNHAMHTLILPLSVAEFFLQPYHYPSMKKAFTLIAAFDLAYMFRILWVYHKTGTWVYPVLAKLSPAGILALFFLSTIVTITIYQLGKKLNHRTWGVMAQPGKQKQK